MACSADFVQYVTDQLNGIGDIVCRKMFGEYGIYKDGLFFAVICGDQLFVKITPAGKVLYPDLPEVPPYDGAKPYFLIEDIDDRDFLNILITATCNDLPEPKRKKTKN